MSKLFTYGSVGGAAGNRRSYPDMRRLSATTALATPGSRSVAMILKGCAGNISEFFMMEQDKAG